MHQSWEASSETRKAILGISAFYHDSAAAFWLTARSLPRPRKNGLPGRNTIHHFRSARADLCSMRQELNLKISRAVSFYDKPFLKFERLLETYHAFVPKGFGSFFRPCRFGSRKSSS